MLATCKPTLFPRSAFLALGYPVAQRVFDRADPIHPLAACSVASVVNSGAFLAWTGFYTVPRWQTDVLDPIQKKDQWVSVKIYCIRNEFWQMVDGEKKTLVPNENDAKEVGGFGFRVSAGGRISVRNIEALVLEEK